MTACGNDGAKDCAGHSTRGKACFRSKKTRDNRLASCAIHYFKSCYTIQSPRGDKSYPSHSRGAFGSLDFRKPYDIRSDDSNRSNRSSAKKYIPLKMCIVGSAATSRATAAASA